MRAGTVVVAEKHPNADRILRLEIDFDEGQPRQILSGLADYYTPEELVGKQVIAGGRKALPSPCPVLLRRPRKGSRGEQRGAFGQRQKTPPSVRDGGGWNKGSTTIRPPSLFSCLAA